MLMLGKHWPTRPHHTYLSKQRDRPRSSLSPIQYQLSSPHGETIVFDLFPPPLRFSDISKIEGLLNYVLGSELTTKKPRNENMQIMPATLLDIGQVFRGSVYRRTGYRGTGYPGTRGTDTRGSQTWTGLVPVPAGPGTRHRVPGSRPAGAQLYYWVYVFIGRRLPLELQCNSLSYV